MTRDQFIALHGEAAWLAIFKQAAEKRMELFDSMPREIRQFITTTDVLTKDWVKICERVQANGNSPTAVRHGIKLLRAAQEARLAQSPAAQHSATLLLSELGL